MGLLVFPALTLRAYQSSGRSIQVIDGLTLLRGVAIFGIVTDGPVWTVAGLVRNHRMGNQEVLEMATFISLINFTDQGIRSIRDLPERWKASQAAIEAAGGSIQLYLTMGQYDEVAITEFPNDQVGAIVALTVGSHGNIRTTTLKAFNEEEALQIVAGMPPA